MILLQTVHGSFARVKMTSLTSRSTGADFRTNFSQFFSSIVYFQPLSLLSSTCLHRHQGLSPLSLFGLSFGTVKSLRVNLKCAKATSLPNCKFLSSLRRRENHPPPLPADSLTAYLGNHFGKWILQFTAANGCCHLKIKNVPGPIRFERLPLH